MVLQILCWGRQVGYSARLLLDFSSVFSLCFLNKNFFRKLSPWILHICTCTPILYFVYLIYETVFLEPLFLCLKKQVYLLDI